MKPLGQKAYGSIPHLPNSRLGPGDWSIHEGQARILTEKCRDRHDRVIVTEKLDGSCVSVARVDGDILAIGRAGFLAASSPYQHIQQFAKWVDENPYLFAHLDEGERVCGEWVTMAHGTIYSPQRIPFIAFDLMAKTNRFPHDVFMSFCQKSGIPNAHVIHDGAPLSVDDALAALGEMGFHGALELPEGCVWKCERKGAFDFNAKFVRPEKIDGKYLVGTAECTLTEPIWFDSAPVRKDA